MYTQLPIYFSLYTIYFVNVIHSTYAQKAYHVLYNTYKIHKII